MSAEHHDGAGPDTPGGPRRWSVDGASVGSPTVPLPAAPLDVGPVGTPVLAPYSFATRDSSGYAASRGGPARDGFVPEVSEAFDPAQRGAVLEALKLWEGVSGLAFIKVPDTTDIWSGGIRFLFQARFGRIPNGAFVDRLHRTALDRQADPDGLAA